MNFDECTKFAKRIRELDDSIAVNIKVDWRVALQIVVDDLVNKYQHNVGRDEEWAEAFKKVLSYYLDEQEMAHLTTASTPTNGERREFEDDQELGVKTKT